MSDNQRGASNGEDILKKEAGGMIETNDKIIADEKAQQAEGREIAELKDKYLRLYAEFENYKKRVQKDKEDLIKYGNETFLFEILPVLDNLEMALKHSENNVSDGLLKGVEITLKEFLRIIEKFGMVPISALGKPFDPALHHAMSQIEKEDVEDKTVIEEFRKGYMLGDKVLRPSLVAVSKKPSASESIEIKIIKEE